MGDRAPASFTVCTCPDQHIANAIIGLANEYSFTEDGWNVGPIDNFTLGKMVRDVDVAGTPTSDIYPLSFQDIEKIHIY